MCVCVCVRKRERERVCVCVCERERERVRERETTFLKDGPSSLKSQDSRIVYNLGVDNAVMAWIAIYNHGVDCRLNYGIDCICNLQL